MWVLFTLGAVIMQTARNALQSQLSEHVDTAGVTLSRFLFAPPVVAIYLLIVNSYSPQAFPTFTPLLAVTVVSAAFLQIAATSLMVMLFKQKNFAIGAGLAKSEALVAGVLGTLFFGSALSALGWLGIIVGGVAVFVLSSGSRLYGVSGKILFIGVACGTCFALTSLLARTAINMLALPFLHSAAWVLLLVLCLQTVLLTLYITLTKPQVFKQLLASRNLTLSVSVTSCLGSICLFSAIALQHVALVKTLAQLEVLLTLLLSHYWLKQRVNAREICGLCLIGVAAVLVMWV